eukprot:CAMPEP_0115867772 /NCGR_PEP_ID=MMETSP0287-20121206/20938_1 /TAXON_ID=412157 /ORGANISM="Chrysochromulina rotalis, Strain UIO044" /LENGTH=81 /DNA_ID=CAMNT_0003322383 /DNA_START=374 /DNA_END=619 /DNA_ORIENTATION=+
MRAEQALDEAHSFGIDVANTLPRIITPRYYDAVRRCAINVLDQQTFKLGWDMFGHFKCEDVVRSRQLQACARQIAMLDPTT